MSVCVICVYPPYDRVRSDIIDSFDWLQVGQKMGKLSNECYIEATVISVNV